MRADETCGRYLAVKVALQAKCRAGTNAPLPVCQVARTRAAAIAAEFMGHIKHEKAGQELGSCNSAARNSHFVGKGSGLSDNVKAGISVLASPKT